MFVHPLNSNTTITNVSEQCIQPNAVDVVLDQLFVPALLHAKIYKDRIEHRLVTPMPSTDEDDVYVILPHQYYQFETEHDIEVGEGEVGWLIHRSSLARNGVFITSGLYDAGFRGKLGGVLFNASNTAVHIQRGARIGQFVVAKSESIKLYDGQYQDKGVIK